MSDEELRSLPTTVNLTTAGRAFGMGRSKAYELARAGEFPCPVLPLGSRSVVTKHHLLEALGLPASPPAPVQETMPVTPPVGTSAGVPAGGVPVVLVIQAVLLPGTLEQLTGAQIKPVQSHM